MKDRLPASARTKRAWWSNLTKGALQAEHNIILKS